jgi:hypothetical protein
MCRDSVESQMGLTMAFSRAGTELQEDNRLAEASISPGISGRLTFLDEYLFPMFE